MFNGPKHGHAVDLNNNGNMDILMTGSLSLHDIRSLSDPYLKNKAELNFMSQEKIVWYENPGDLNFEKPWVKHIICEGFSGFEAIATDLDNDGNIEVIASALGPSLIMTSGGIAVFKHNGNPKDAWDMKIIKDDWNEAHQILAVDVNSNGLKDIVGIANCAKPHTGKNELIWWENLG